MTETITNLIDELIEAIEDEEPERARRLIANIGDRYDELATQEQKRIRQATLLRGPGGVDEVQQPQLEQLTTAATQAETKRGAFLLRSFAAVLQIEQGEPPGSEFNEAVSDLKEADEQLKKELTESEPIIQNAKIPPSLEILDISLVPSTIEPNKTAQLDTTIANIGSEAAETVEITIEASDGIVVSNPNENLGAVGGDEELTRTYDIEATNLGDQRIRLKTTSTNAGSDLTSTTLTVTETDAGPTIDTYADQDGFVRLDGLRQAIKDWRENTISSDLLKQVTDAWRRNNPVT